MKPEYRVRRPPAVVYSVHPDYHSDNYGAEDRSPTKKGTFDCSGGVKTVKVKFE